MVRDLDPDGVFPRNRGDDSHARDLQANRQVLVKRSDLRQTGPLRQGDLVERQDGTGLHLDHLDPDIVVSERLLDLAAGLDDLFAHLVEVALLGVLEQVDRREPVRVLQRELRLGILRHGLGFALSSRGLGGEQDFFVFGKGLFGGRGPACFHRFGREFLRTGGRFFRLAGGRGADFFTSPARRLGGENQPGQKGAEQRRGAAQRRGPLPQLGSDHRPQPAADAVDAAGGLIGEEDRRQSRDGGQRQEKTEGLQDGGGGRRRAEVAQDHHGAKQADQPDGDAAKVEQERADLRAELTTEVLDADRAAAGDRKRLRRIVGRVAHQRQDQEQKDEDHPQSEEKPPQCPIAVVQTRSPFFDQKKRHGEPPACRFFAEEVPRVYYSRSTG